MFKFFFQKTEGAWEYHLTKEEMSTLLKGIDIEWNELDKVPRITTLEMTIEFQKTFEHNSEQVNIIIAYKKQFF